MINQEYYLNDGNHYIPDEEFQDYSLTDIEILPKKDGSQGVSIYDKGSLVAHIEGKSANDILTVYKEDGTVYINLDDEKIKPHIVEGEGIIIEAKDETANTIKVGLNKITTDDIKTAIEDATTIDAKHFGKKIAEGDVPTTVENSLENNPVYTNYIEVHNKTLHEDGSITTTTSFIDFNDFILDEGTWD